MAEWLGCVCQGHEMYHHDLEMSSNPSRIEFGVRIVLPSRLYLKPKGRKSYELDLDVLFIKYFMIFQTATFYVSIKYISPTPSDDRLPYFVFQFISAHPSHKHIYRPTSVQL